ncbi:MAG: glutathione S-transferase family protein [Thermoplasmatota archaeon]
MKAAWNAMKSDGKFRRKQSEFRSAITKDGPFLPESGRYHLYVSHACPWAHRTMMHRALLGLEDHISVSVVDWHMQPDGSWQFDDAVEGATPDHLYGAKSLQEVYKRADPEFGGIGTVPILWDKHEETIVNNESREIIRMFNDVLGPAVGNGTTLAPAALRPEIDAMIDANYEPVNNGVYKCGFARTQEAYDEALEAMFTRLDELEAHLEGKEWLVADQLTEADICLFVTLLRFDPVYHTHFKCNRNLIAQMPNLAAHTRRVARLPGIKDTIHTDHIKNHYYWSHTSINPFRIVPAAPAFLM